jgi:ADP-heptose:LPS heptosyltransferase
MTRHVLVVRLDSLGDMVVCGPAVRAVAARADRVTVLAGPACARAATLLPGVDEVLVWHCPWILADPPSASPAGIDEIVGRVAALGVDEAVVLTSFHQSALPTALVLRMAGVPWIAAVSEDYPGSLLDVRISSPPDAPEPDRMRQIAAAAGFPPPPGDDGELRINSGRIPDDLARGLAAPYIVVHPGATAAARMCPPALLREVVDGLLAEGWRVAVTGGEQDLALARDVSGSEAPQRPVLNLAGRLSVPELAAVLKDAAAVVVGNTGPAHLAAAVGTPVVSLFSPVVPAVRWAPYTHQRVVLGDQSAACRNSRATTCPVPGHPCLSSVTAQDVIEAVHVLTGSPHRRPVAMSGADR